MAECPFPISCEPPTAKNELLCCQAGAVAEVVELVIHWLQSSLTKTQFRLTRSQVQAVVDLALESRPEAQPRKPNRLLKQASSRRNQIAARISDWLQSSLTKTRFTLT